VLKMTTLGTTGKGKGHAHNRPQEPKRFPGLLRPRIFLTLGTTRVVRRQPHAPAALTPRGNPWYSFLEAESTPGHMVPSVATEKIPSVTPLGIDPGTVRLVAQCLNHYVTPDRLGTTGTHVYSREQLRPCSIRSVDLSVTSNRYISVRNILG
jgi:hypothetical protein